MSFLNLKNFWQSIKSDWILLSILLLGLLLRGLNPTFGSLSLYVSNDEAVAHQSALNMLAEKTPVSIANYTPFGAWVQIPFLIGSFGAMKLLGIVSNLQDFELFVLTHEGYFLFIPRLISTLFGTLMILVIYKLAIFLFAKKEIALMAAFLTAVSFNLVHISHFGKPWSAALFFISLAIYLILKKSVVKSFFWAAVSYGFHQVGILILPLLLLVTRRHNFKQMTLGLTIFFGLMIIFNILTLKSGIVDSINRGQSFLRSGTIITDFLAGNHNFWESFFNTLKDNLVSYFLTNLLVTDGIILVFATLGIFKISKGSKNQKELFFYCIGYLLFASLFFHPLLRYLLPMIVILIPFAALGIHKIFGPRRLMVVLILAIASINSVWWNWLYLKTPTFIQAHRWLDENVSEETPIAYTGGRFQTFVPSSEAIRYIQTVSPNAYQRLASVLDEDHLDNVRNVVYVSKFPGNSKFEQLANATANYPVEYIIDYYLDDNERLYNLNPQSFEVIVQFNPARSEELVGIPEPLFDASWNFPANDPRPKVSMYSLDRIGPYFDILKLRTH